ncbi:MAG TPA: AAA family ATPase, partial [Allocoleopsis sp.]
MSTQIKIEGHVPTNPGQIETIKLNLKLHTIILLVGPSGAGKTQFCFEQLMIQLKMAQVGNKKINIQYISSDAIRRELLDNPAADKMDKEMTYVSHQAFELLFGRLKCATSYPVNADFIIVDTTGLDPVFRQEVLNIAKEKHYNVSAILFDYKNRREYNDAIKDGPENMAVSNRHIDKFKQVVLSEIRQKDYESIHRIKSREFEKYEIVVADYDAYDKHVLPFGPEYVVIGDIHGSYDEFVKLLDKHGFVIDENK